MNEPNFDLTVGFGVWDVAKIGMLFALLLYILFAFVIIRQVNLMTKTVETGFEEPLKFVSLVHFFMAIGTFVFAALIL